MTKGILQIFFEKIQEAFGGEKTSSEATFCKNYFSSYFFYSYFS